MKKVVALLMSLSLMLCLFGSVTCFAAESSIDTTNSIVAYGNGEITLQKEWSGIAVDSTYYNTYLQIQVIGTSGAEYTVVLTKEGTSNSRTLGTITTGAGQKNLNIGTLSSGTYRLYLYTWDVVSASGVVWTIRN